MRRSLFLAALAALLVSACGFFQQPPSAEALITSFTLSKADNSALSFDATSVIDSSARTIRVFIDPAVSNWTALVPSVAVDGTADLYPPSGQAKDFTQTPATYKLVHPDGTTTVWYVTIKAKPVDEEPGAIRITEYFCGTGKGSATTGELNRYLELYNGSSSAVDLSQFQLVQRRFLNGTPDPSRDQKVWLKGIIAAQSFYLISSSQLNSSFLPKVGTFSPRQSDTTYNGIMDSDGTSTYQLLKDGTVIDSVGPNDGSDFATDVCWYRRSLTATGLPGPLSAIWHSSDWASAPIGGLLGEDANAGLATPISATLISLLVVSGDIAASATIDQAAKTATVLLPEGVDSASLTLAAGSYGTSVLLEGTAIVNGSTKVDLSTSSRVLTVKGQDGTDVDYSLSAIPRYSSTNYNFDGGIQAVANLIWAGGSYDTPLGDVWITGVVTAKNIYPSAFVLQDQNAGIYFYTQSGITFPVGSKVRVKVTTGKVYYGLAEVTDYDPAIESAGAGLQSIYYLTGDYANQASIGMVFRYDGTIAQGGLSYFKGQFGGALYFHYPSDIQAALSAGATGVFYGPVTYTRDNYTMELVTPDQFAIR